MTPLEISFLLGILFLLLFFSPSSLKAAFSGAPFLPAPQKTIRRALKLANLKPNENLYDLGSGTGKVLIIAAKEFGAKATGFEYSTPLFILSKINLFLKKIKNANVRREDFYKADLRSADVIFLFLTPRAFPKLKEKFERELKSGARIVCYSSPLLFWEPEKIIPSGDPKIKIYLYILYP